MQIFPRLFNFITNVNLLKFQNKMCIVATIHQKLLHEIDDVLFISNGCIEFKTRAKEANNEGKLNFVKKNDINVSQSLML